MGTDRHNRQSRLSGVAFPVTLICSLTLLSGCSQETADLERYIAEIKARPAQPLEQFEEPEDPPSHVYPRDPDRDPFNQLSFREEARDTEVASGPRPDPDRPRETLEEYPLDSLRMSGLLEREGERFALVRDPQGTVHRVREGNYLGQNHGRIVEISERRVDVLELVRTGEQSWTEREAALSVRDDR
ncbi:pilus assembly protein PilP [Methylonatrum kenyense]|uniref:pilus assembly protein PilP n=1 Tax=Methylonatrum kenyense TaxID=455253 RepID=UPI0020BD76AB|nr:pilus assembly protein PilP [Methylonatrum kenyense]MCK8516848.1 pilus assembly protein PilP [Methylonatrum kenyense]